MRTLSHPSKYKRVMSDDINPAAMIGPKLVPKKEEASLKLPVHNSSSSGEILCEPSEHLISQDTTSRAPAGPLHSFDPSPRAGVGSSEGDVASSEVSSDSPIRPPTFVPFRRLISRLPSFIGRERGRTGGR